MSRRNCWVTKAAGWTAVAFQPGHSSDSRIPVTLFSVVTEPYLNITLPHINLPPRPGQLRFRVSDAKLYFLYTVT